MVEVCPTYSTSIWPGADSGYTILHNARQLLLDPIISDALGRILFDGATGWIDGSENLSIALRTSTLVEPNCVEYKRLAAVSLLDLITPKIILTFVHNRSIRAAYNTVCS